jgi:hypothetical protein
MCHITTNLLHPSVMVRTGFHIALKWQGRSSVIEVVMQEKCAGHKRLTLPYRRVHGRFAQQDDRQSAEIERISPESRKDPGSASTKVARKEISSLPDTANLNATTCLHRHSPQIAPAIGTGYLTGVAAREGANSPRQIGRLVSAAVPFPHTRAVGLKGWLSSHPVLGG